MSVSSRDIDERREAAAIAARASQRDRDQLFHRVFSTEDGRDVLRILEEESFVWHTTLTGSSAGEGRDGLVVDIHRTIYHEGMRALVLRIRARVRRAQEPDPEIQLQAHSQSAERLNIR